MSDAKNQVDVLINGKIYKLGTEDGEDYIRSVAEYVDRKYAEIVKNTKGINRMSDYFPIMLALNIADDLFKQSEKSGGGLKAASDFEGKIYNLEKELDAAYAEADKKDDEIDSLKAEADKLKHTIETLEAGKAALAAEGAGYTAKIEEKEAEIKNLKAIIADAGLIPPTPDKYGKIKDKDKDRETLLKELNDIKSENGRTKKENKTLSEKLKQAEEELAILRSPVKTDIEAGGQLVIAEDEAPKDEPAEAPKKAARKTTKK